ncbi:DUF1203 domain-containing protein [Aquimarina sp. 2201CG14-23]|uniref:DUF1203 domain-containing protein n=1 Tax=Aquimarina mycalae TaxID=3040073 RepID=UPI002477F85C|nr:DUF1203 domain-containing protein [Aquimarina sp. 2201CG14-23]MDH7448335.1 DUF1203 domain-containing protein [Aquimarina sp. 2201CG14-23]
MNIIRHNFQIKAIDQHQISHLFLYADSELRKQNSARIIVDKKPGVPCRVSLEDANIGEEVILFSYQHHNVSSPYKASGPIYVRKNQKNIRLKPNEIPFMLTHRLLSVRGYNDDGIMMNAITVHGIKLLEVIQDFFDNLEIKYLHIHNANPGCYNCHIDRIH